METSIIKNDSKESLFMSLKAKALPILSWGFSASYQAEIKHAILDSLTISSLSKEQKWENANWNFKNKLKEKVVLITDAKLNIVFASKSMTKMNGYQVNEVIGKKPKMFQGKDTSMLISAEIREAILAQKPFIKKVLNYKKSGLPYYCKIEGFPIFNKKGELVNFIAFEEAA
jgi:PAS domain S-box-containing protein